MSIYSPFPEGPGSEVSFLLLSACFTLPLRGVCAGCPCKHVVFRQETKNKDLTPLQVASFSLTLSGSYLRTAVSPWPITCAQPTCSPSASRGCRLWAGLHPHPLPMRQIPLTATLRAIMGGDYHLGTGILLVGAWENPAESEKHDRRLCCPQKRYDLT